MLTKELVIAIAAAVFLLFNLFFWLIVRHNNKKAKPADTPRGSAPSARPDDPRALGPDDEEEEDAPPRSGKIPEDFVILESIVLVHTKETL